MSGAVAQKLILFIVFASAAGVPIISYFYFGERYPHFRIGLAVLAVGVVLTAACGVAEVVFNLENDWLDGILYSSEALIPLASVITIWQAIKKSKAEHSTSRRP